MANFASVPCLASRSASLTPLLPLPETYERQVYVNWLKRQLFRSLKVLVLVAFVVCLVCHTRVGKLLDTILMWCGHLGWGAPVVLCILTSVSSVLMLPTFPVMVAAGVVLPQMWGLVHGQVLAIAVLFVGLWIGSMISFAVGRALLHGFAEKKMRKLAWMSVVSEMIRGEGWWVILLLRMSPLLPAELFNYACAFTSVSYGGYALGCTGSIVPISVWVSITASIAGGVSSGFVGQLMDFWFLGGNLAFLCVIAVIFYCAYRRYVPIEAEHIEPLVRSIYDGDDRNSMERYVSSSVRTFSGEFEDFCNSWAKRSDEIDAVRLLA